MLAQCFRHILAMTLAPLFLSDNDTTAEVHKPDPASCRHAHPPLPPSSLSCPRCFMQPGRTPQLVCVVRCPSHTSPCVRSTLTGTGHSAGCAVNLSFLLLFCIPSATRHSSSADAPLRGLCERHLASSQARSEEEFASCRPPPSRHQKQSPGRSGALNSSSSMAGSYIPSLLALWAH